MALKITAQKDKQFASVSELFPWSDNPKLVLRQDFERLKKHIEKLGQFKPLVVTPEGEVIGGNARLEALRALGIDKAWVSIVEPKNDAEKLEYALADNDNVGKYIEEDLAELVMAVDDSIELEDYKIDVGRDIDLKKLLDSLGPSDDPNSSDDDDDDDDRAQWKKLIKCPECGHEFKP